jgi:hypothetical protein
MSMHDALNGSKPNAGAFKDLGRMQPLEHAK